MWGGYLGEERERPEYGWLVLGKGFVVNLVVEDTAVEGDGAEVGVFCEVDGAAV